MIVLSDVQRKLSRILLQAEDDVIAYVQGQFLMALLVWIGIVFVIGGFIWGYQVKLFIEELNEIKGILGVLPIGLVR